MIKNISLSIALIIISYGCDMNNDDEYKPDIKIEIEHNLPEINGYHMIFQFIIIFYIKT